jgi:glycosyltransferase involved in cell wall biosynthesis
MEVVLKVSFFQPILTAYREPLFSALSSLPDTQVCIFSGVASSDYGVPVNKKVDLVFDWHVDEADSMRRISVSCLSMCKKAVAGADIIVHFADFKYFSFYACLFYSFFLNKKIFLHGQGGYKRTGVVHTLIYNIALALSDGYICYCKFSKDNLEKITLSFLHKKISVVDNSLYLSTRKCNKSGNDVLYIGRLREGCGIELLLEAAKIAGLNVRIVGDGEDSFVRDLRQRYQNFSHFGAVFDEEEQITVAQGCLAGAYGGDAGLSVVHYMAYGLPVIVHDDLYKHMGPEPSYIVHGENGLTFQRGDLLSLVQALTTLKNDVGLQNKLAEGAAATFQKLNTPPMHEKFAKILGLI